MISLSEKNVISEEIIELDRIAELVELSKKIDDGSGFVRSLQSREDKKLYKNVLDRLRKETRNELTETEYANLARMMFWCDRFEALFAGTPASDINIDLYNAYRITMSSVTEAMKDYREKTRLPPSSVREIRNYIITLKNDDYGIKDFEEEVIIIDANETKEDET